MNRNLEQAKAGTLIAAERRRRIHECLLQKGSVRIVDLAKMLNVAENTVRNDLAILDKQGKLVRSHGGAILKQEPDPVLPYSQIRCTHMEEKSWIGAVALDYMPTHGCIYIGGGSTTYQMAVKMPETSHLEVVTNSAETAIYLSSHIVGPVEIVGGRVNPDSHSSDGTWSQEILARLRWDVSFVGAEAIDIDQGITAMHITGALQESQIFEQSKKTVVLCDSSKLRRVSSVHVGPVSLISVLITDNKANPEYLSELARTGTTVVIAGPDGIEWTSDEDSA